MKKINQKDRNWEPGSHEDPQNPGVYKKVLVRRDEADSKSKMMMFQLCKIPPKTTHVAHSHPTMDEIFYFTEGKGAIEIEGKKEKIVSGDRIIVPAGQVHQIRNTGKIELKFIGIGVALD
ncbi:MAG TPA: cupin domain-containing protein [Patescibacteria group bacterium]|nr:cupin domain-containing protein [Patescibacteria group bacterium]